MDNRERAIHILDTLRVATRDMPATMTQSIITIYGKNPFLILISCLLSLRAKDRMTLPVCYQLFSIVQTPRELLSLPTDELEKMLYPLGFYKQKTKIIKSVCKELLDRFEGKVPRTEVELLSMKGVGRKTAALVLSIAFDIPAICVDVHVHRIANRLGIVATKTPYETEEALKRLLPMSYWQECNSLFVIWGQNICTPRIPKCSICPLNRWCKKIGVEKSR